MNKLGSRYGSICGDGRWWRWLVAAMLLAFCVLALLTWLHFSQRQAFERATRYLGDLRQAQIELAKGFLQISLADGSRVPFNRHDGLALLQQAVASVQRASDHLGLQATGEAQAFSRSAKAFQQSLQAWRNSGPADAKTMAALRIAYADLEHLAARLDVAGGRQIGRLTAANGHVFVWVLGGALLALGLLLAILMGAVARERRAQAELLSAYQANSASETRFRRLFQDSPLAMALIDANDVIVAQNARCLQIFGYANAEASTMNAWWYLVCPDPGYRVWAQASWQDALMQAGESRGEMTVAEYKVTCKDGSERIVEVSGILMDEGFLASFWDVTERRRSEDALRLWSESFEQAQVGMVIADASSDRIVSLNSACAEMLGFKRADMAKMALSDLCPDLQKYYLSYRADEPALAAHVVLETECRCGNGRRFPVLLDVTLLRDKQGRPLHRFCIVLDISGRKQAEQRLAQAQASAQQQQVRARLALLNQMQDTNACRLRAEHALSALRESESRLKFFIDYAPAALAMLDRDMRYLACSHRWLNDYGLGERELFGLSHYQVFPEITEAVKSIHRRALDGEVVRADEDRFQRADGSVQWLRWEVRPWYGAQGAVGGILIFSEDITARVAAQRALSDSQARLHTLIQTIPDLVWLKDTNGVFLLCNPAFERLLGAPEAEIVGKTDYDFVGKEVADFFRANDQRALESQGVSVNEEWLTFAGDGYKGLFQTLKMPVVDGDGQVMGVLGIARDITRLRQVEQDLRDSNAGLENRVAERTAELEALNQSLESFVYSVSHDLKAPLRGIEGYSQLLVEDYADRLDGDGRLFLNNIRSGVARMGELIDDLLDYSRMERRKLDSNELDLPVLVGQVLAEREDELATRGVEVRNEVLQVSVLGDANGLRMVLRNLLENALKFSAKAQSPRIAISAEVEQDAVVISIEDNGIGFDMLYHDRIFEIFQRLHRLEDYPGTGVGLALVKKAMQRMGGEVWAESTPGQGARFFLKLPLAQARS